MRPILKNKKGDMFQLLLLLIILFIAAIVGLIFLALSQEVTQAYDESGLLNGTAIGQDANNMMRDTAPYTTDYMILFLFLGGTTGLVISAIRTNFSPTIIFLFILLMLMSIFVASGFVNIYRGFADTEVLSEYADKLTFTNFLFSKYLPLITCVLGAMIMMIMWGKSGGDIIT